MARSRLCLVWQLVKLSLVILLLSWFWPVKAQSIDLERRIGQIESIQPDRRISVLENRLDNIESVGKGILVAVAAQLILSGLNLRARKG